MTSPLLATVELLTPKEVATLFQVVTRTVTRWAREGVIPGIKTAGGMWRFHAGTIRHIRAMLICKVRNLSIEDRVRWLQREGLL